MGGNDGQERTEEATPRKRQEARRKGTVAKSNDLNGALALLAAMLAVPYALEALGAGLTSGIRASMGALPTALGPAVLQQQAVGLAAPVVAGAAVVVGAAMLVGLAANFAQVGFTMSGETLSPRFEKLNPINGVKRLFSWTATVEGLKALAKFAIFGWIAYGAVSARWEDLAGLAWLGPGAAASIVGQILHTVGLRVALAWLTLAAVDYFFQRKMVDKQLRMTKDELKREMREQEGAPEIKAQMAQRRRKLAKGRLGDRVKLADVVVTNPEHFAVAIQYDRSTMPAPIIVAKGQDYLALRIRELAKAGRVPIVPNPPLARSLYRHCEVGDHVPRELFQAVAEVLAYVYQVVRGKSK